MLLPQASVNNPLNPIGQRGGDRGRPIRTGPISRSTEGPVIVQAKDGDRGIACTWTPFASSAVLSHAAPNVNDASAQTHDASLRATLCRSTHPHLRVKEGVSAAGRRFSRLVGEVAEVTGTVSQSRSRSESSSSPEWPEAVLRTSTRAEPGRVGQPNPQLGFGSKTQPSIGKHHARDRHGHSRPCPVIHTRQLVAIRCPKA